MDLTTSLRAGLAAVVCGVLGACAGTTEGGDCTSRYDPVARASTWKDLRAEMLDYRERGRVVSVRTQTRGHDVGAGDREAVRVVDLLDRKDRRLVQADVWRTDSGAWRAGVWRQCID